MEGPASGGMLAQQLSVLVQCHACQATLQVTLPEEVRLHRPPVLKIRCNSCTSHLEVSMPPSAYDVSTQAAARAALAMQQAVQARAQVAQARQQQLLLHTYQQGLAAATSSAAGLGRGASSGASLQHQLRRIEQEWQQARQAKQEEQQAQQRAPPEGQGLHAPGQRSRIPPQPQQAQQVQQAQQQQQQQPPLGPIPTGGLDLHQQGDVSPNLSLPLPVLGSPPSPLPTGLDLPLSLARLPSGSGPAGQQAEHSLEPASPDDFARLLEEMDFSPLASPPGSLAFPAAQPPPALHHLQQLCTTPQQGQQVQQQLSVPTYPPLQPGCGTPGGNASLTPLVHVEVRPRPDYEPGAAPARDSAHSSGGASSGGFRPEAAGTAAGTAPEARAVQRQRSSTAQGAAPGAPQQPSRPVRLKLRARPGSPGAGAAEAQQAGTPGQTRAVCLPASPAPTGRAGKAKAPRTGDPTPGSQSAAGSEAAGKGSTVGPGGQVNGAAQGNQARRPKQAAAGGNGRSGRGTKRGASTAAQGSDGVKRTAYQHYTKAEYARLQREHPHLPKQQLFDHVIQGWQTSPMNPNRQASTNAEDGQVQPATAAGWAATGKPGGGKAAAGRGRPAAAKAPTPKAQAAKTQGQGGRAGRQPQGPAAALLDAERRRAAQHSAPTPRK